jgi:dolichyl-diphosphooligosaccharide--protein glycosyltransferase
LLYYLFNCFALKTIAIANSTCRILNLLLTTHLPNRYIPIIASVSEHQPPTWAMYFTDLHLAALLMPAGFIACLAPATDASIFLFLYGVTAVYFSGVMVRLMLVLAPAACCLAGLAASELLAYVGESLSATAGGRSGGEPAPPAAASSGASASAGGASAAAARRAAARGSGSSRASAAASRARAPLPRDVAYAALAAAVAALAVYFRHSVFTAGEMYSAPSIVLQTRGQGGGVRVIDDFREAYAWLSHNTPPDAKIASWWDYGYQTTAMANRTVLVDNNTWNNTHIATVGRALAKPEAACWAALRALDCEYVLVVFGAYIGYPSDDINKFLWMVRIGGGVFPDVKEADYLDANGNYRVDAQMGAALRDSAMYRLSYYRFADVGPMMGGPRGYDRVRQATIGLMDFPLTHFEEAFTSEQWMVRVYKLKDAPNRDAAGARKSMSARA